MLETAVTNGKELVDKLNMYPNSFIYRGQSSSSWKLTTSLERACGNKFGREFAVKSENYAREQFSSRFHLYDRENVSPSTTLEWLSLMQHYGVPTRLLDFTSSPYAALFFALETYDVQNRPDIAIYCINYSELMDVSLGLIKDQDGNFDETRESIVGKQDQVFEDYVDRFSRDILWVTEPQKLNSRIDRQAGCFLVSGNKGVSINELVRSDRYKSVSIEKITFPGSLIESVFVLMRKMNISGKSIYGDLSGLAKSIALEIKIYAA